MRNGGYQILNLSGLNFVIDDPSEPVTLAGKKGTFETIRGTNKAVLLSGLTISGTKRRDVFINKETETSSVIVFTWAEPPTTAYRVSITSTDNITIQVLM